ncbi:MBL fold metallo-hydrolase [Xylophilus sp. GOD-11R]|uniref:MBL fold metallo-hydrolase n=1 Tax=Xylophilus sp. GOD-11R TaxID=3089814 RepID=UPI00298C2626|nr:MBL fold metallo-hydrolase [Xylophilus sp. GOD-11R]WPB55446.1 MBL fold metallo-hydrolase [Xylophilus sp. GOD-11R]
MVVRFKIGTVTATRVEEMIDRSFLFRDFFRLSTEEDVARNIDWMAPGHYEADSGRLLLSMHSWLVDTGRAKILIDGCIGNDKDRPGRPDWCQLQTPFLERLAAAGARPEDIDYVLCTHLHADHVGWNTRLVDGRWVPTFPNAKYVFGRKEHEFWAGKFATDANSHHLAGYRDSVLPVVEAGQAMVVDDYAEIADCLVVAPTPGHTPGHVALWLTSGGEAAVFTGDMIHHPVQLRNPGWSCFGCIDQVQSVATRTRVLGECVDRGATLLPAHFLAPFGGKLRREGEGFWWGDRGD